MKAQTKLIHTTGSPDKETGSVVPPIHLSTIFRMDEPNSDEGFQYGRVGNPTRQILEQTLADLEEGRFAVAFSSGSAAITTLLATLKKNDHIICHVELYEGTARLIKVVFENFGIRCDFVDIRNTSLFKKTFTKQTKMVFMESPTNPSLSVIDIASVCAIAHQKKALVVVDNTFATPIMQKPLLLGTDIVIESLTKAINGHSDALGGIVVTNNEKLFEKIKFLQHTIGAVLSPFESFLILRGLKTLSLRIKKQEQNAIMIANFLKSNSNIKRVFFPGFQKENFIQKQMQGPGFMISFIVKGEKRNSQNFIKSLKLIIIAHSLGGSETCIQQPMTMMDLSFTKKVQKKFILTNNFFRISVGLEDVEDIIADLDQALKSIDQVL